MRKCFLFIFLLFIALFAACSLFQKPDKTVAAFFKNLVKADFNSAQKHLTLPIFEDLPDAEKELLGIYFGAITIGNIKVIIQTESTASVSVDITAVDIIKVVQDFMVNMAEKLANEGLSVDNTTDEQIDAILIKELRSKEAPYKTMTATLTLNKQGNMWLIVADQSLRAAFLLQDYDSEAEYYGEEGPGYSVFDTINVKAVFNQADEMMGICSFTFDGKPYQMYCEPEQMEELSANYVNKEVAITYQVLRPDSGMNGEEAGAHDLYILSGIAK